MNENWQKRVAVITGGGSGIGRATAVKLAKQGMKIILFGGKRAEKINETAELIKENGGGAEVYAGNLTDFEWLRKTADEIIEKHGVDVLINNAGMAMNCGFGDVSEEQFDKIMDINVKVPFCLTQKFLPALKRSDRATVINLSSVVGHAGYAFQSAYTASKHALLGFTKALAAEVYKDGIRVHAISPGGVYTDMVRVSRPDLNSEGMIMPEDIADIVWFFLCNRGNAVVDEIIVHRLAKQPFLV